MTTPALTWLYVPGDRPDRFPKAAASGADVVIIDLEDAVAPTAKDAARSNAVEWLTQQTDTAVEVRINGLDTEWAVGDLAAVANVGPARTSSTTLRAVRVPKIAMPEQVHAAAAAVPDTPLVCLIESALGIENAYAIASASRQVVAISLGEADLAADLAAAPDGLDWARSRVIVAARAAGLQPPAQSAYINVADLDGLRESCMHGRRLGFRGRAAVHPRQLPVIRAAYLPNEADLRAARAVLDALDRDDAGVALLDDGRMVDAALAAQARDIIALAQQNADHY